MANSIAHSRSSLAPLRGLVLPAALLLAWLTVTALTRVDPNLLPSPATVLATGRQHLVDAAFWSAVAASLARTFAGFGIAATVGIALGVLLGVSRWADRLVGPTFHAWRQVAVFAWIPLISAWFGGGDACKIAFIAVASVAPVIFNTFVGVRSLATEHRELARVLEVGRVRFVLSVVIPSAAPQLLVGLHLALVTSWLATFGSEFFLQITPGVGSVLIEGRSLGRMDMVIVGIFVIGGIGFGLNAAIGLVERYVLRWRPSHQQAEP
ncbi:MAG: ABC transporter permease [Anaeromyxobacteraceae bacterium]